MFMRVAVNGLILSAVILEIALAVAGEVELYSARPVLRDGGLVDAGCE